MISEIAAEVEVCIDARDQPKTSSSQELTVDTGRLDGNQLTLSPMELQAFIEETPPPGSQSNRREHSSTGERSVSPIVQRTQLVNVDSFVAWVMPRPTLQNVDSFVDRVNIPTDDDVTVPVPDTDPVQDNEREESSQEVNIEGSDDEQTQEVSEVIEQPHEVEEGSSQQLEQARPDAILTANENELPVMKGEATTSESSSEGDFYDARSEQITGEATPSEVSDREEGQASGTSNNETVVIQQPVIHHISAEALMMALQMEPPAAPIRALAEEDENQEICPPSICRQQ